MTTPMTGPMTGPVRDPGRRALLAAGLLGVGVLGGSGLTACGRAGSPDAAGTRTGRRVPGSSPGPDLTATPTASVQPIQTTRTPAGTAGPVRPGPDITHGSAGSHRVALTFHGAGDPALLRRMLADFADAGARMTVMAIGQWLAGEPAMARAILDGGHELGNHTWSHQTMPRLTAARTRDEIDRAAAELRRLTGSQGRWFRPSGTPHSTSVIRAASQAAGYGACLSYDVDPMDYQDPGAAAVLHRFGAAVGDGSVVSLHLGHPGTVEAMPAILDLLRARGLEAVTASELLIPGRP